MALENRYDFSELKNSAEESVLQELEKAIDKAGDSICTCEECVRDMLCYALNHVTPRYQISLMGILYSHSHDKEFSREVDSAVRKAVKVVSENPAHG